jgi:hypothetical protein
MTATVKLPSPLAAKVAAEARARHVSKSAIIREILGKHYSSNGRRQAPTFYDVNRDLIGCVKGTHPDLTTNPKYMEGYGE